MPDDTTLFQYCQKIVLFRNKDTEVLLACRKGEADYDGVYSFIGGKMETTDRNITEGLLREKCEEVGTTARVRICPFMSHNTTYVKKDGTSMVLPHYYAQYLGGDILLSDEYSDFAWVPLKDLDAFEPKISDIPEQVRRVLKMRRSIEPSDFVVI